MADTGMDHMEIQPNTFAIELTRMIMTNTGQMYLIMNSKIPLLRKA